MRRNGPGPAGVNVRKAVWERDAGDDADDIVQVHDALRFNLAAQSRPPTTGHMQLVSIPKGVYLRLSDFVNEYDFADYEYPPTDKFREFHKYGRTIEAYPELAR